MKLGTFIEDQDGNFRGKLLAYGLPETVILLVPEISQDGRAYFAIVGNPDKEAFDGGAAFPKQKGKLEYLSLTLDSPVFAAPIYAVLFPDKARPKTYNLVWERLPVKPTHSLDHLSSAMDEDQPTRIGFIRHQPSRTP